jgi:hypothetical protein
MESEDSLARFLAASQASFQRPIGFVGPVPCAQAILKPSLVPLGWCLLGKM